MKNNKLGIVIGFLLLVIFGAMLFLYQVRVTEVAVKLRFGKVVAPVTEPGLKFKLPWPIERVQKFDRRIQNFEDRLEESLTQDGRNLMMQVYLGWLIEDPALFRERFADGSLSEAQRNLEGMVRSAKNEVVSEHPLSHFINTDESQLQFEEIENEILGLVQPLAQNTYGIQIKFLGIKRLEMPPNITQRIFDRMRAERQKLVTLYQSEGEAQAATITANAERERSETLSTAEAAATRIRGEADAQAAEAFRVFQEDPELALLILKLDALEKSLRNRATLILDDKRPPFDVLREQNVNSGTNE